MPRPAGQRTSGRAAGSWLGFSSCRQALRQRTLTGCTASPVEWLVSFAHVHQCWDWPTWRVQRDIVRPACAARRCRYAELPEVVPHCGGADLFVSHCWGATFGTLVGAAILGARRGRRVWVDLFAVRQFPGNEADLDFDGVVARSNALLLVADVLPEMAELDLIECWRGGATVPAEVASRVAFSRAWCLVELAAAMRHAKPIVLRCGRTIIEEPAAGTWFQPRTSGGGKRLFVPDEVTLAPLFSLLLTFF